MDGLVNGLASARDVYFYKTTSTTTVAGDYCSFYQIGGIPSLPAIPSSIASTCTSTTVGAGLNMPGSTELYYIGTGYGVATTLQQIKLFDRLHHCGGLVTNSTTPQAVNVSSTGSFDTGRCSSTTPVCWFLEWYTTSGATGATVICDVTYTDGSTGTISYAAGATRRQSFLARLYSTASPMKIIQSVSQLTWQATTGTAGSMGVTAARCLCDLPMFTVANYPVQADFATLGMPQVLGKACLWPISYMAATASGVVQLNYKVIPG